MRVDDTALKVMAESGAKHIWYGDPDLICEVSLQAGCKQGHPLNRGAAVMRAIALSHKFKNIGAINHLGRWYRVYKPKAPDPRLK